jgi:hypothetical protein
VNAPRDISRPEPGFYKRRLAKNGPWTSVRFFLDDGTLRVEIDGATHRYNGEPYDIDEEWPSCWPSDEAEYRHLERLRTWAIKHAAWHPAARPRERIDLGSLPPRRRP